MLSNSDHDRLVAEIYSAAMGDTPWTATLGHVADLFRSSASLIQVHDQTGQITAVENHGYSREFSDAFFASEAYANDPRMPYFRSVRPGTIYFDRMLYDLEEMERNRWCRESCDILKVKYQLGAMLRLPNDMTAGFAILSSPGEGHASPEAIQAFHRLAPHIERACALGHVIEFDAATRSALLDALTRKSDGVILLDGSARPTFMSDAAAEILRANDGIAFLDGTFVARRPPETRKLQNLIGSVVAPASIGEKSGGRVLVTRPSGRRPYVLHILPAPPAERFLAGTSVACVMHMQDLARTMLPSKDYLRDVFGLTAREADFAAELVRHTNLENAALHAGMAVNTARNHLQSTFRKTGTSSQAELVQLFTRLV
ncbi:MAG: helix-turn-helix transcriptional regulator [Parvibaculum sp.]|uniref:helix-turn-helix transcriptional regulator n=1 Tax=Parvibaculum sp. TaxID=2024848 RepID=UPI00283EA7B6|nr:helix-turn-helix transcriptional regulator [Parvibaculum sp.]MDR3499897.1 helix-turn-helix transcriptional regulator [Parvibaculum sp.]